MGGTECYIAQCILASIPFQAFCSTTIHVFSNNNNSKLLIWKECNLEGGKKQQNLFSMPLHGKPFIMTRRMHFEKHRYYILLWKCKGWGCFVFIMTRWVRVNFCLWSRIERFWRQSRGNDWQNCFVAMEKSLQMTHQTMDHTLWVLAACAVLCDTCLYFLPPTK